MEGKADADTPGKSASAVCCSLMAHCCTYKQAVHEYARCGICAEIAKDACADN